MAEVVIRGLSKRYETGTLALRDLELSVASGELLVVVGPSGCGKTTLLRLIAGLEAPTTGRISIDHRDVTDLSPRCRDIAFVFQRPALYPQLKVRDNLEFGEQLRLWPWMLSERRQLTNRVIETARLLEIEPLLNRYPAELSGGEQQRVALGRAVVRRPKVYLLDEPLSSLDATLRSNLRRQLHLLQRQISATMIYVTHDQTEAMTLGDRVAVLDRGVLQQWTTPDELTARPANRFVASFFGAFQPGMNFLDGRLEGSEWVCGFGRWPVPGRMLSPHQGPLTIGLRPADLIVSDGNCGVDSIVRWSEEGVTGSLLQLERDGIELTAWCPGRFPRDRRQVKVMIDMNRAHLFDWTTGLALSHPETG